MTFIIPIAEIASLFTVLAGAIGLGTGHIVFGSLVDGVTFAQIAPPFLAMLVAYFYNGLYDIRKTENFRGLVRQILRSLALGSVLLLPVYLAFPETRLADTATASLLLLLPVVGFVSLAVHWLSWSVLSSGAFQEQLLIVGNGPLGRKLADHLEAMPGCGARILGFVQEDSGLPRSRPNLGSLPDLAAILARHRPDRIVVALREQRRRLPLEVLLQARADGIPVESVARAYERLTGKLAIESLNPSFLIFSETFRLSQLYLDIQRVASLLTGLLGLVVAAPLMALIALAIRATSKGPALFVQARVGRHAEPFPLYKFRTMTVADGPTSEWARDNADRITTLGHWLRKFRLDELPQLWNLVRGDMNLVGPRPHPVSNHALFAREIPYYALRSSIRPGLTGWAQIRNGYAHDLDGEVEKMRYDLYYISRLSPWFDLRILLSTVKVVLLPHAADHDFAPAASDRSRSVA